MTYRHVKELNVLHNDFDQLFVACFTGALCNFALTTTADLVGIFV